MRRLQWLLIVALMLLAASSLATAQDGEWQLAWSTIDGGGATTIGGDRFALSSTIGQPDAGTRSGGVYVLKGGFWAVAPASDVGGTRVYLPLILR